MSPTYKRSGGDYHFLRIRVAGDRIEPKVVTERGEQTDAEADVMSGLQFSERSSSRIGIGGDPAELVSGLKLSCSLENPYLDPLSGRAAWSFDRTAFDVQPDSISIQIPQKGAKTFEFTLKALQIPVSLQALPRLEFRLASEPGPPVLDGKLEDWAGVPHLQLPTGVPSVPEAAVRAFHDGEDLYLAVTVPTPARIEAADPYFRDDLQLGLSERVNETEFGPDRVRLGFARAGLAIEAKDRTAGHKPGDVLPGVRGACLSDKDSTTYEIAVPAALLKRVKAKEAGRFVLDLSYFIPEGESGGLAAAEPKPNSFSYQVRFGGGNALSPAHFIELLLGPRPIP